MSVKIYDPTTHSSTLIADKKKLMIGASADTAGRAGYVPAPQPGDEEKFLRGDGTWSEASGTTDPTKIGDVLGEMAYSFATTASIVWQDPEDASELTWGGTLVVKKNGGVPSSPEDGTTIVDNKVRNAYATNPLQDTGLSYGTTYYYRFFPYTDTGDVTDGSYVSVTPSRRKIAQNLSINETPIYSGSQHQIEINGFDPERMDVTGNTATNAGSYTAVVTPKEGYCWTDGTYSGVFLPWSISKANVSIPSTVSSYVYDGTTYSAIVSVYDHNAITITGTATSSEVGIYEYTMALSNSSNYQWSNGTIAPITKTWQIMAGLVDEPLIFANLTYNGLPQSPTITRFDSGKVNIKQGGSATDAGTHTIVFELIDPVNYAWSDGATQDKSQQWVIKRATLSVPTVTSDLIFNGEVQNATISAYDPEKISITGASGTNARTYTATIQIIDKVNYMWTDGTDTDVQQTWTISKKGIPIPTVGSSLYYTGQVQYAAISEYDPNFVMLTGISGINAGTYTATKSLVDPDNTLWTNGETADQYQDWVIRKAELVIPTVSADFEYDGATKTASVTTYDPSVISVTGITGVDAGTYYATIRIIDKTNYIWNNGTSSDVSQEWSIRKKPVAIPTVTSSLTYTGYSQTATVSSYDSTKVNVTGITGINAGTYTATLSLLDNINCEWSDGTVLDKSVTWSISKAKLSVPTVSGSFTYDGTEKTATVSSYDSSKITVSGLSATNAGTHEAVMHINDSVNYSWTDNTTADKTQTWTIAKLSVSAPAVTGTSKTYNGYEQSPTISSYDTSLISVSGDSATNAGNYTVVFTLKDSTNYQWASGSKTSVAWSIARQTVTVPTISGSYTYDGTQKSAVITNNSDKVNITNTTSVNAGTITCTMTLKDTTNYSWTDGSITAKTGTWYIAPLPVTAPYVSDTTKTYNGSSQGPYIGNYDHGLMYVEGTTTAINAGTYTVVFTLVDPINYAWTDPSMASVEWQIQKQSITVPSVTNTSMTYNGSSQGPTIGSYDSSLITISGTSGTNAGTYYVTFSLRDPNNYQWESGSSPEVQWTIAQLAISAPSVTNKSKTYTGSSQGPTIGSYDTSLIRVEGATAINAGSYTVKFYLKDTTNYKWTSGTSTSVSWSIAKASGSVSVNKTSVSLTNSTTTATVTVSSPTGAVTISSSNTSVATVSPSSLSTSGGTITITGKASGSATIYLSVAESTNYNAASNAKTISVSVSMPVKPTVKPWATATNAELQEIVDAYYDGLLTLSEIQAVWSVGDERSVSLAFSDVLTPTYFVDFEEHANQTVKYVIMNFGGKTLTNGKTCLAIVGQKDTLSEIGFMNAEDNNSGGWNSSDRRFWCNNIYIQAIPSGFRGLFKEHRNVTSLGSMNHSLAITSDDYFALPSEKEVLGSTPRANATAESDNKQFKYYETAANRKKKQGTSGNYRIWWTRSPRTGYDTFDSISESGTVGSYSASNKEGLAPFGCI